MEVQTSIRLVEGIKGDPGDVSLNQMNEALALKEDKINPTAGRVIVSDSEGEVTSSDITTTELSYLEGVTGNIQTQFAGKENKVNLTANRALVTNPSGGLAVSAVTSEEIGYLDGVSGNIQTQLNGKQATISLSTNKAVVTDSNGAPAASAVTATELGYLDGVTSNVQTQLNAKQSTLITLERAIEVTCANANEIYTASATFTQTNDGYYGPNDLQIHSAKTDTANVRIDGIIRDSGFTNTSVTYHILYHGVSANTQGTIFLNLLTKS